MNYIFEHSDYKYVPDEVKKAILATDSYTYSHAFAKYSGIIINRYNDIPITDRKMRY